MSIEDYYNSYDRLMASLLSMVPQCIAGDGCSALSFIERFLTYRFVMGVRDEFDSLRTRLLHSASDLTMAKALSELLAEETRLRSLSSSSVSHPHSVLAASHRFSAPKATSSDPCKHCGKFTHTSDNCFSKHPEKLAEYRAARAYRGSGSGPSSKGSVSVAAASPAIAPSLSWVLDSGASFHVTSDKSQLAFSTPVIDGTSVQTADGTSCSITHQGSLSTAHFTVPNVSLVPQLSINLLSVGQITNQNCFIAFDDSPCFIQDRRSGTVIGTGHRRRGSFHLYILDTLSLPSSAGSTARVSSVASSASSFAKWHHRLGHLCGSRLSTLINSGCLGQTSIESSFQCKGCTLGKQIQLTYSSSTSHSARRFDLIHSDVWGPTPFATKVGHKYYVILLMITLGILGFILWNIVPSCVPFTPLLFVCPFFFVCMKVVKRRNMSIFGTC